jgi:uncharacterized protein YqeY
MSKVSLHAAVRAEISRHLTAAVKSRDRVSMSALRAALCALDNATAVPLAAARPPWRGARADVARRELTRTDIEALLLGETEERSAAAAEYDRLGLPDRAGRLRHEAAIIRGTLEHVAAVDTRDAP